MKELGIAIRNPTGLHARPAKVFVNTAKQFQADIRVYNGAKKANAKSLISMLALGVEAGTQINITAEGPDEVAAIEALQTAVQSGLGEEDLIHSQTNPPAPIAPPPQPALTAEPTHANQWRGIPAAPGIAIGPLFQFTRSEISVTETFSTASAEETRLQGAIEQARGQLTALRQQMLHNQAPSEAAIFDVHLEILDDPELLEAVLSKIGNQHPAAQAWQTTIEARATMMSSLSDALLAARAADIHDVGYRVLRLLVGAAEPVIRWPDHPIILIAHDLSPSDTAALPKERVLGFCTAVGGPTAHSAIIARALSLPAVVSAGEGVVALANQTMAILDGRTGILTLNPDTQAMAKAQAAQSAWQQQRDLAVQSAADPATTQDGHRVEIVANVGGLADTEKAQQGGAEGVGLLRTEFLFLERTQAPTEEEQFAVYKAIAEAMHGHPVIVRTLDIGGDKPLPYIEVPHEANPFLGERGIRLCLNRQGNRMKVNITRKAQQEPFLCMLGSMHKIDACF